MGNRGLMVINGGRWVIGAIALVILVVTPASEAVISCGTVVSTLAPCFEYVLGGGNQVPSNCCSGVTSLYKQAVTTADRQVVCSCLKSITGSASSAAISNAEGLPKKCGVNIPYKITPAIDCNKVS